MSQTIKIKTALYTPNLVNVCVDKYDCGEIAGRIYHCYDMNPWHFGNVIEMIELMEDFFDRISFPQASTKTRTFADVSKKEKEALIKLVTPQEVAKQSGKLESFLVNVKSRQNSAWQGEVECMETGEMHQFISVLDLLKILSNTME